MALLVEFSRAQCLYSLGRLQIKLNYNKSTNQIKCWFLVRGESWSTREQSREPTNPVLVWRRVGKSNLGHSGGRRVLWPLRQPCSLLNSFAEVINKKFCLSSFFFFLSFRVWNNLGNKAQPQGMIEHCCYRLTLSQFTQTNRWEFGSWIFPANPLRCFLDIVTELFFIMIFTILHRTLDSSSLTAQSQWSKFWTTG